MSLGRRLRLVEARLPCRLLLLLLSSDERSRRTEPIQTSQEGLLPSCELALVSPAKRVKMVVIEVDRRGEPQRQVRLVVFVVKPVRSCMEVDRQVGALLTSRAIGRKAVDINVVGRPVSRGLGRVLVVRECVGYARVGGKLKELAPELRAAASRSDTEDHVSTPMSDNEVHGQSW